MDLVAVVQVICIIMVQQQFQLDQKQSVIGAGGNGLDGPASGSANDGSPHQHLP